MGWVGRWEMEATQHIHMRIVHGGACMRGACCGDTCNVAAQHLNSTALSR